MNPWLRKCLAAMVLAGAAVLPFAAYAQEEKVQKITFVEDDAQKNMASKIYTLKHTKAADLAPFVRNAVVRYCGESHVSPLVDVPGKRQLLVVSTGVNMIEYVDAIVATLDYKSKENQYGSSITGDGIEIGFYKPKYRSTENMKDVITEGQISSSSEDSVVKLDPETGMFYFKDTPLIVSVIKQNLAVLDRPEPQARVELKVYELRDSDLRDIGVDYLAWKNGPGMDIFQVGYEAFTMKAAEKMVEQLASLGVDVAGNFSYGFGGMYTAPAFVFSFIRILQQNGKATVNSSAMLTITNTADKEFRAAFSPEYQNIEKDEDHMTTVGVGGDATLDVVITEPVITGGKNGVVNFTYSLYGSNVVERNNMGAEIAETTTATASTSLNYNQEKLLMNWERVSEVEQTIGIPFLCELPILKYIFGTTTTNQEKTYYFVTARAVPVAPDDSIPQGVLKAFDELAKQ